MGKIEDFTMHKLKHGDALSVDQGVEALGMVAIFGALQLITQEINAVAHCFGDEELFPKPEDVKRKAKQAAILLGNDNMYNLRELLRIHTANLEGVTRLVDSLVTEPDAAKRIQLDKWRYDLTRKYMDLGWTPIITDFLASSGAMAKQQAERLRNYQGENQDGVSQDGGDV